jgi:signal transduction histidine kinase
MNRPRSHFATQADPIKGKLSPPHPAQTRGVGAELMTRPQVALITGFAIVFALWLAWGYQLTRSLAETERSVAAAQDAHLHAEQVLLKVRTNVLLGSIYLRDAIIDGPTSQQGTYGAELRRLRTEVDQALRSYTPETGSPEEQGHWRQLQIELGEFWVYRDIPFLPDAPAVTDQAAAMLRERGVPRRDTIIDILDQLAVLQAAANQRRQAEFSELHRQVRRRLLSMGGITMALAIIVAIAASLYMRSLQRQIERQRTADRQNREDLERLSARLVDAQEQERRQLARELHDEVGQALTAVKMDIGIALRSSDHLRVRNALTEASDLTETTLRGVRDLSQLLHPSALDDFGLPTTLTTYLRSFSQRTGIQAHLVETVEDRLAPQIEVGIYRIDQEALHNVARHSEATSCTVSLNAGEDMLHLVIEDNGRGLRTTEPHRVRRGLGLIGMRERAQALGGTFRIGGRAGGGTRISAALPMVRAAHHPIAEPMPRAI